MLRDTFGDADRQGNLCLESFLDTGSSQRRTLQNCQLVQKSERAAEAIAYGTKRAVAVAPVSFTASLTFLKTGRSR
jgi:hypothetical protein